MQADAREVLKLMVGHEMAIKRLYDVYAGEFPASRELWLQLAAEEEQHAAWLRSLWPEASERDADLFVDRFRPEAVRTSLSYVESQISMAQAEEMSLTAALSIALDLENSLIEQDYFRIVDSDSPGMRATLERLAYETQNHRHVVRKALDAERVQS